MQVISLSTVVQSETSGQVPGQLIPIFRQVG